ncbi:MAG: hypothetical protein E6370_15000 [Clostridiales bacterium]|nr:hypothetical protein [Clostridiales bacterium]MDU6975614.1 hypothetical protein [Clostridiales bacterium]
MKKNIFLLIILTCSILCIVSFIWTRDKSLNKPYITITETAYSDIDVKSESGMVTALYTYWPDTQEVKKQYEFPYTAQYPLGAVDLYSNSAYYSQNVENIGDQLFRVNLEDGRVTQITDNLYAINYIIPTKEKIYFAACLKGSSNICLGAYNKGDGKISYWGNDGDVNIANLCVNEKTQKIYVSTFSENEMLYNLQHQTNNDFVVPKHIIYEMDFDFKDLKKIHSEEHSYARLVMNYKDNLLILSDSEYNNNIFPSKSIYYDLKTNKQLPFTLPQYRMESGGASFSVDGKGLYVLTTLPSDVTRSLYFYNFKSKDYQLIYKSEEGAFLNNFQLVVPD